MFKKLSIFGLLLVAVLGGYLIYGNSKKEATKILGSENATPNPQVVSRNKPIDLEYNQQNLLVAWEEIDSPEKLNLIPNFTEKLSSSVAKEKYDCRLLASAGFYSKEAQPLGLFVTGGKTLSRWQTNYLLNGVFSVNNLLTPRITRVAPKDDLTLAVQSGPLVKENATFQDISVGNNNLDRRALLAVTGENKAFYLIIYTPDSAFAGPKLADLPKIVQIIERRVGMIFADVINLDGGTASAFLSSDTTLSEASPVGSFFCLKN